MKIAGLVMEWIASYGGPLICMEAVLQDSWGGNEQLSVAHADAKTDYDRACISNQYTSVVPLIGGGEGLVLGMGAFDTSFWRDMTGELYLVQVECSEPGVDEDEVLNRMDRQLFADPKATSLISFGSAALVIFDSVDPGDEKTNGWLSASANVGRYAILTRELRPSTAALFIIHKFEFRP